MGGAITSSKPSSNYKVPESDKDPAALINQTPNQVEAEVITTAVIVSGSIHDEKSGTKVTKKIIAPESTPDSPSLMIDTRDHADEEEDDEYKYINDDMMSELLDRNSVTKYVKKLKTPTPSPFRVRRLSTLAAEEPTFFSSAVTISAQNPKLESQTPAGSLSSVTPTEEDEVKAVNTIMIRMSSQKTLVKISELKEHPLSPHLKRMLTQRMFSSREMGLDRLKDPPFPTNHFGTFSCHGIEPDPNEDDGIHAKINQDRGCCVFPFNDSCSPTGGHKELFLIVLDGHGQEGDRVAEFAMPHIVKCLENHPRLYEDPSEALIDSINSANSSLLMTQIKYMMSGATCVAVYMKGEDMYVANVGDSRAVMGSRPPTSSGGGQEKKMGLMARDLSTDQKPDSPGELERILACGGFVGEGDANEGYSARVFLDEACTSVGLAMSRSIGDFVVKSVGVTSEAEVKKYCLTSSDLFLIVASDGVWEFISSQEAVETVYNVLCRGDGAQEACKKLILLATERWQENEGDYRDDITAIVLLLPPPPPYKQYCIQPRLEPLRLTAVHEM